MRSMYLKILTLTFVALICSACKTPGPWYKFGSNATNNGFAPTPTANGRTLAWSFNTGLAIESGAVLDSANNVYIASTNGTVFALTSNDMMKWQFPAGAPIHTTPAVEDNNVYFGDDAGLVHALNSQTGTQLWSFNTKAPVMASVSPAGSTLYVANTKGEVYCINTVTGKQVWKFSAKGEIDSTPAQAPGGALYFGTNDGYLYALNAGTGKQLWRATTTAAITAAPAVGAGDHVYVGSNDGLFHAFDATGTELWTWSSGGEGRTAYWSPAAVIFIGTNNLEIVYVANGATVAALKSTDATVIWQNPPWFSGLYVSQPAVAPDGTYLIGNTSVTGGALLIAADRMTGTLKWSALLGGARLNTPAVGVDGRVYTTSGDGNLYVEK